MKRKMPIVMLTLLLLGLFTFTAAADNETGVSDTLRYEITISNDIRITGYTAQTPAELIIPDTINGLPVREIAADAFRDCDRLVSVKLPDTLRRIGYFAFANTGLSGFVDIPAEVTYIYDNAFYGAPLLGFRFLDEPVTIREGYINQREETLVIVLPRQYIESFPGNGFSYVRVIDEEFDEGLLQGYRTVVDDCTYLVSDTAAYLIKGANQQSVTIPAWVDGKPVREVLPDAFFDFRNLQEIMLPEGLERIGQCAFQGTSLTSLEIPSTMKWLDSQAFHGNQNLRSVHLDVPYIGDRAFAYCGLENITFGSSVCHIGDSAFAETNLREVTVPEGIEELHYTFFACKNLTKIVLPESLRVFDAVVQECTGLTELTLPEGVTEVRCLAMGNAVTSLEIPAGVRVLKPEAFGYENNLKELTLHEGLELIETNTLETCTSLTELWLPASLRRVESMPDIAGLTVYYHTGTVIEPTTPTENRATYVNLDTGERKEMNYAITIDHQTFYVYDTYAKLYWVDNHGQKRITVPEEVEGRPVTVIAWHAFHENPCQNIVLPQSLERIEAEAIYSCPNLIGLDLPASLQAVPDKNGETGSIFGGGGITGYYIFAAKEGSFAAEYIKEHYKQDTTEGLFLYTGENPYIFEHNHVFHVEDGEATLLLSMFRNGVTDATDRVPGEVNGFPVTTVAKGAYIHAGHPLQHVVFESPLRKIEDGVFPAGYMLEVTIPKTVTEIGDNAFGYEQVTIYCAPGSYAEDYAITHGYFYDNGVLPFTDVPKDAWYAQAVRYCYWAELMNGTSATTFDPQGITTRAMMVQVLYNMAGDQLGSTMPEGYRPGFTDIVPGAWYEKAVCWAEYYNIVNGVSSTSFRPNDPVSREQLVTIIYRFAKGAGLDKGQRTDLLTYTDGARVSAWAKEAMEWAVAAGIINGTTPTTLSPEGNASRAEIATILMRFAKLVNA